MRRAAFEKRLNKIRQHNADPTKTWKEGVNHLTDRFDHEFRRLLGYKPSASQSKAASHPVPEHILNFNERSVIPDRIDWRERGVVSPVKDQGTFLGPSIRP